MSTIGPSPTPPEGQIAIVYNLVPMPEAAGVAAGEGELRGIALATRDGVTAYLPADRTHELSEIGDLPRLYPDALLARAVEQRYGLPTGGPADCLRTLLRLTSVSPNREKLLYRPDLAIKRAEKAFTEYDERMGFFDDGRECVYRSIELPTIEVTEEIIHNGLLLDIDGLEAFRAIQKETIDRTRREINAATPRPINPRSSGQVAGLLYGELGLPVNRRTRNGHPSTGAEALRPITDRHPVILPLVVHQKAVTLHQRANELLSAVSPETGRVHTHLDPLGAATGRFTSRNPAVQNLPPEILHFVTAPDGHVLLEADFSQIELRVLAAVSEEPRLLAAFAEDDVDLHRLAAAASLKIDPESVTDQQRKLGKQMNFAIVYGQRAAGLAESLGISVEESEELITAYFQAHPRVRDWIDHTHAHMATRWCVRSMYGRRRLLQPYDDPTSPLHRELERRAVNTVIQGSAADILKFALIRLHRELPPDVRLVLTVHDSVVLEVPADRVEQVRHQVVAVMETSPPGFAVPLRVDVSTGRTWAECKCRSQTREHVAV